LAATLVSDGKNRGRFGETPFTRKAPDQLECLVQIHEPRLVESLRGHAWQQDLSDGLQLRVFNNHEMVARAMIRECRIDKNAREMDRILVLGVGPRGSLGETLILRAAKDRWIDAESRVGFSPLEVHVYDDAATRWVQDVQDAFGDALQDICRLIPHDYAADRCGFRTTAQRAMVVAKQLDAVFICLSDEPRAIVQALQFDEVLPEDVPIIVSVRDEEQGSVELLEPATGRNRFHVVGTLNRLFDIAASTNPMLEILAQVIHHDYLMLNRESMQDAAAAGDAVKYGALRNKAAFTAWRNLEEPYRQANRDLAERLTAHFTVPQPGNNAPRRFELIYQPHATISPETLFSLSEEEIAQLAKQEHNHWLDAQSHAGWRLAGTANIHGSNPATLESPNLLPWGILHPDVHIYDKNIIRRLPFVFAKADYCVVERI
jgi:hypothetical protein